MLQKKQNLVFSPYRWEEAKEFYINSEWRSGITLETVTEHFNIPYQSVRRRAAKERWRLIREWKNIEPELESVDEYIRYYK